MKSEQDSDAKTKQLLKPPKIRTWIQDGATQSISDTFSLHSLAQMASLSTVFLRPVIYCNVLIDVYLCSPLSATQSRCLMSSLAEQFSQAPTPDRKLHLSTFVWLGQLPFVSILPAAACGYQRITHNNQSVRHRQDLQALPVLSPSQRMLSLHMHTTYYYTIKSKAVSCMLFKVKKTLQAIVGLPCRKRSGCDSCHHNNKVTVGHRPNIAFLHNQTACANIQRATNEEPSLWIDEFRQYGCTKS
ncbi:uncharacterized protein V6R79_004251 [Siganus canaliculatus]